MLVAVLTQPTYADCSIEAAIAEQLSTVEQSSACVSVALQYSKQPGSTASIILRD
jgi:hypothetical protein